MSTRSYALSKKGSTWWASGKLASGREFRFECGKGSREAAEAVADLKMAQKTSASKGSKARWAKWRAEKDASSSPAPAGTTASSSSSTVIPPSTPPATPTKDAHNAAVWARLKALGDAAPAPEPEPEEEEEEEDDEPEDEPEAVEADEIIAPGEREKEGEDDDEAEELISDAIATAVVMGTIKIANAPLKKRNPPQRGEPDDRFRDLEHKGIKKTVEKLVGGHMRLSPGMQILVGALGTVVTVWLNAEEISPAERPYSPPAAAASSGPTPGHTNGAGTTEPPAPASSSTSLSLAGQIGVFGVEKVTSN